MAHTIDVFIVSELATVRAGLAALLASAGDVRVVGEASAFDAEAVARLPLDVAVVLVDTPAASDVGETVAGVEGSGPGIVVLGPPEAVRHMPLAEPPLAWAVLARDAGAERIVAAVRAVAAGLVVLDLEFSAGVLGGGPAGPLPGERGADELTAREREVLALVATGLTNKAIARRLAISDHTVKFHVASILAKVGAESRTEAVHLATRRGLLTL